VLCPQIYAQDDSGLSGIAWEHGPVVARVSDQATINLRKGSCLPIKREPEGSSN